MDKMNFEKMTNSELLEWFDGYCSDIYNVKRGRSYETAVFFYEYVPIEFLDELFRRIK